MLYLTVWKGWGDDFIEVNVQHAQKWLSIYWPLLKVGSTIKFPFMTFPDCTDLCHSFSVCSLCSSLSDSSCQWKAADSNPSAQLCRAGCRRGWEITMLAWQRQYEEQYKIVHTESNAVLAKVSRWHQDGSTGLCGRFWSSSSLFDPFSQVLPLLELSVGFIVSRTVCFCIEHTPMWDGCAAKFSQAVEAVGTSGNKGLRISRSPVVNTHLYIWIMFFYTAQCTTALAEWRIVYLLKKTGGICSSCIQNSSGGMVCK